MLTAVKGNREAKINEDQKEEFLRAGYDIIDESGKRTVSPSKTVPYAEIQKYKDEIDEAKVAMQEFQVAYDKALGEIDSLRKENDKLKKELEKAKKGE